MRLTRHAAAEPLEVTLDDRTPLFQAVRGQTNTEVVYFTDSGAGRGALMIVDLDSAAQIPHVTEPLMLNFSAAVHYRVAMSPEELQAAGLDRYATG